MTCKTIPSSSTTPTVALSIHVRSAQSATQTHIPSFTYRSLLAELGKTLKQHQAKKDTLSLKLHEQGKKFEQFVFGSPEKPSDASLLAHINELRSLVQNPFGNEFAWDILKLLNALPIPTSSSHQIRGVMIHRLGVATLKGKQEPTVSSQRNSENILSKCDALTEAVSQKRLRWEHARFALEVGKIGGRHKDKKDPLSLRLFTQVAKFSLFVSDTYKPSNKSFQTHVDGLRSLLCNPFTQEPLKSPWLVGNLVWEEADLTTYCQALSFFVSDPIVKTRYLFGIELFALLNTLPTLPSSQPQGVIVNSLGVVTFAMPMEQVPIRPKNKQHAAEILQKYSSLMEGVAIQRDQWKVNQFLLAEIACCSEDIEKRNREDAQEKATISSSLGQVFTDVREGFEALTKERQYEKEITFAQLDRTEKSLEKSQEELARAQVEIERLKCAYSNLANAYNHLAGRCSWLEGEIGKDSCSFM